MRTTQYIRACLVKYPLNFFFFSSSFSINTSLFDFPMCRFFVTIYMSLFQSISVLISFFIFALATKQKLVNGITNNSYTDICNKTPLPGDCNLCFLSSPGSGRADVRALAKIMIDACATNQACPLLQMFDNLNATDPIPSSRAISAYCSSKYLDITKSLSTASIDLVLKKDQEARSSMQTAISLHYRCFDLLKNRTLPGDMGTYLRNFGVYAVDTKSIIDQIPK